MTDAEDPVQGPAPGDDTPRGADADRAGATPGDAAPAGDAPMVQSRIARRRRAERPVAGRTAALVTAAAVVVGVGVASLALPTPAPTAAPSGGDGVTVAPVDARSSSLFCTSGVGTGAGAGASVVVVLANSTRTVVHGVMTTIAADRTSGVRRAVTVPPLGTADVTPTTGLPAGASSTTFSFTGGGVTGSMVVAGPSGWSTAPCASAVSPTWEFAGGSTSTGALDLSLYNPTAAEAVVNLSFLTTAGQLLVPQAYQGIALGSRQTAIVGLGAYVQQQSAVTTLVQAASGAVVATELDQVTTPAVSGLALVTGTPDAATTWRFAQTTAVQGGTVTLVVGNPGVDPVAARVTVGLSGASVTPRVLTVPPHGVGTLAVSAVAGWPLGSPYAVTVSAPSPVVVGRTVVAPSGAVAPQAGLARGVTTEAGAWLVVGPGSPGTPLAPGAAIRSLAVADPGPAAVDVTVTPLAGGPPVASARVMPGGLVVFGSAAVGGLRPLVVRATGDVVVEADDGPAGAPGVISTAGVALPT